MSEDELRQVREQAFTEAEVRAPRVLCFVNHYFGPSRNFRGKSTSQAPQVRRAVVERSIAALREAIPGATVRVCGIPGRALVPLHEEFHLEDPRLLVYESLNRMAAHLSGYDWFVNIEDDIEVTPESLRNALEFERSSLPNECLLPNRLERHPDGSLHCIDVQAIPGWTQQERRFGGHAFRVALNPHSGVLMLSREKFAFALGQIDRDYRGHVIGGPMASAYAHFHKPLALYRCFDDPTFHSVFHLDGYGGPLAAGAALDFSAILLSWKRPHNLPAIVRALREIPQIREILVWNNDPSRKLELPGVTVVDAPRDFFCLARYAMVPLARFDNIWFQDDDLLLRPNQFAAIAAEYAGDPSRIHGARGRNIRNGRYVFEDAYGEVDIVLGQTMMFHRRLLKHAFETLGDIAPPSVCDDIAFSLSCPGKHFAVNVEPIEDLGTADDAALFRQPGHAENRQLAVEQYLAHFAARRESAAKREIELQAVRSELERVRAEYNQLANSVTTRLSNAVKRVPLVYAGYLRAKRALT